jgi:hypothetical protein
MHGTFARGGQGGGTKDHGGQQIKEYAKGGHFRLLAWLLATAFVMFFLPSSLLFAKHTRYHNPDDVAFVIPAKAGIQYF